MLPEDAVAQPHHRFLQGVTVLSSESLLFLLDSLGEEFLQAGAHRVGYIIALVPALLEWDTCEGLQSLSEPPDFNSFCRMIVQVSMPFPQYSCNHARWVI